MGAHSSILAWRIPQTEEPGRLQSMGLQKSWTRLSTLYTTSLRDSSQQFQKPGCWIRGLVKNRKLQRPRQLSK